VGGVVAAMAWWRNGTHLLLPAPLRTCAAPPPPRLAAHHLTSSMLLLRRYIMARRIAFLLLLLRTRCHHHHALPAAASLPHRLSRNNAYLPAAALRTRRLMARRSPSAKARHEVGSST